MTTALYRTPVPAATAEPTPLRDILRELVEDLSDRLERSPGVEYLARSALRMRGSGAEGFADVEPLLLVAELLELLPYEEPAR